MKKILGISLVAVLAVSPLMAHADNVKTIENVTANENLATTSYVQGAYNALGGAVNTKQDQLTNGTSNIVKTVKTAVSETAAGASDTSLVTEKAVFDAIAAAKQVIGGDTTAITTKIGEGAIDVRDADTVVGALNELDTDLATAESAISANTAAISAERTRATGVESGLGQAVNTLDGRVTANTTAISTLNGDASTEGSVDYKINAAISNVNSTTSGLDDRVTANTNAIDIINNKTISYVTTWNQDATTTITRKISQLPPVQGQGEQDGGEEESGN